MFLCNDVYVKTSNRATMNKNNVHSLMEKTYWKLNIELQHAIVRQKTESCDENPVLKMTHAK